MTSLFSIQVQLTDTTPIFNGYFEVDDTTHVIQHFYDTSNLGADILAAPGAPASGDNTYESGWLSFSGAGCNITSFPYFFGSASSTYDLYGNVSTSSSSGKLYVVDLVKDVPVDLVFQFASIGSAPTTPTDPIAQWIPLYSIQLQLRTTAPIFNGYFETDIFGLMQHFYDTSDITNTDILSSGSFNSADYLYQFGWLSFSALGTNLVSFAAIGASTSDFNVSGSNGDTNIGDITYNDTSTVSIIFVINSISSAPASTDPIPATVLYSVQVKTVSDFTMLNAYFESNLITGLIQHFYDTTDSTTIVTDILTTPTFYTSADNIYQGADTWLSFSQNGIVISSFPSLGASDSEFLLSNPLTPYGTTNDNTVSWNSGVSSQTGTVAFQYITSIPAPTGPISTSALYTIQLQLPNTVPIFNGYFETNSVTNRIQKFYDTSDIDTDILSSGTYQGADYLYQPGWLSLSSLGTNLLSFAAIGASSSDFNISGNTGDGSTNTGGIVWNNGSSNQSIIFAISSTSVIPDPTSPIITTSLFSVQVKTVSDFTILNAYFESNIITGLIQHFYDTTDSTTIVTDILTTPVFYTTADNIYQGPGFLSFSNNGVVITTFPFFGASDSEFLLSNTTVFDGSTNSNTVSWNSGVSSQTGIASFQYITSIPAPTGPIANPTLFSIQLTAGSTVIFRGYFETDGTNLIQHFYDTSDSTTIVTDILSSGSWSSPDNLYQYGWGSFSTNGVNITSFPYYSLISTGDWHITGSGDANTSGFVTAQTGPIMPSLAAAAPVTFAIGPITSAPAPTGPITPYSPPAPPSGVVCFKEGSKILTNTGYKPIQDLRKGDLVQTSKNGYKAIFMIGKRDIEHIGSEERIKDQLYSCKQEQYPELLEELVITGCHSILVSDFKEGERERTRDVNGKIYVTDNKYRLPACVDMRASVYDKKGVHTIYHIALENDDYYMNYGVYANGLLVETCSKRYLKELSNMELL